jgi:2-oxoglutarate ferredoxin oxidoreductase subunit gamma
METGILISGTGGQGIIAAGEFLAEAFFMEGYEVINTRSYGSEARGGSCRSEVIVSDSEIYDLQLEEADILIAFSEPAFRRYQSRLKRGTLALVDTTILEKLDEADLRTDVDLKVIPAVETSKDLGNPIVANMVLLGALAGISDFVSLQSLKKAIVEMMRPSMRDVNLKALEAGNGYTI